MSRNEDVRVGYKVVHCVRGTFESAVTSLRRAAYSGGVEATVEYAVGRRAVPKDGNGPLAVFRDIVFALEFCMDIRRRSCWDVVVFKCRYRPSKQGEMWYLADAPGNGRLKFRCYPLDFPTGTVLADWVELLPDAVEILP